MDDRSRLGTGEMTWQVWLTLGGCTVGLAALVLAWWAWRRRPTTRTQEPKPTDVTGQPGLEGLVAMIVNPTKAGLGELKDLANTECPQLGLGSPIWLETTATSPGTEQARWALEQHPGLRAVVAAGGDGTVRAVAAGLAGHQVPMGIVPLGTANLLARNLKLPLGSPKAALTTALTGAVDTIDVGRLSTWDQAGRPNATNEIFLVIAGLGFDADLVSTADSKLKSRLGWPAYFISGINHLAAKPVHVKLSSGNTTRGVKARSVMFGNCGMLPARLQLVPDADLSDGLLDLAMAETRHGLVGWAALLMQVVLNGLGVRWIPAWTSGRIWYEQATAFRVECDGEYRVQLDGELTGFAKTLEVTVDPLALNVRLPDKSV
ncbi:MAG: diacylglycerol kinase [Micrococcales bacterium]|nr:diacylglycerol kinase [Micrococcales bacterium]